jgi:hypothetical protein
MTYHAALPTTTTAAATTIERAPQEWQGWWQQRTAIVPLLAVGAKTAVARGRERCCNSLEVDTRGCVHGMLLMASRRNDAVAAQGAAHSWEVSGRKDACGLALRVCAGL